MKASEARKITEKINKEFLKETICFVNNAIKQHVETGHIDELLLGIDRKVIDNVLSRLISAGYIASILDDMSTISIKWLGANGKCRCPKNNSNIEFPIISVIESYNIAEEFIKQRDNQEKQEVEKILITIYKNIELNAGYGLYYVESPIDKKYRDKVVRELLENGYNVSVLPGDNNTIVLNIDWFQKANSNSNTKNKDKSLEDNIPIDLDNLLGQILSDLF